MQALMLRLSMLDTGAESAVRVIAYFDSLVRDHVGIAKLLQATATLAQCPVGLLDASTGRRWRATPGKNPTIRPKTPTQPQTAPEPEAVAKQAEATPGPNAPLGSNTPLESSAGLGSSAERGPITGSSDGPRATAIRGSSAEPRQTATLRTGVEPGAKAALATRIASGSSGEPRPTITSGTSTVPGADSAPGTEVVPGCGGAPVHGGEVDAGAAGAGWLVRELGPELGTVWMEREGDPHGLDEIVLERLAVAAEVTLERTASAADPALVELALSADTGDAARARALRLLGFATGAPLQVLTVPAADGPALMAGLRAQGTHARTATVGEVAVVIVAAEVKALPPTVRAGVGPSVNASKVADSWEAARLALRFTTEESRDRVVRWADLGALALLAAHVPDEAVAELPDVRAVRSLPPEVAAAVRALCEEGSVRRAAVAAHLHHSSMAARIARAEAALGFSLAVPAGRLRAHLALSLARLVV